MLIINRIKRETHSRLLADPNETALNEIRPPDGDEHRGRFVASIRPALSRGFHGERGRDIRRGAAYIAAANHITDARTKLAHRIYVVTVGSEWGFHE